MLLHLSPTLCNEGQAVALVDVHVLPFGLRLVGGVDVVARRPYPNKTYHVACRKVGRKAVRGILLAALAYFILPLDAVPDFLLLFGFSDDIAVLTAAFASVRGEITEAHRRAAREALREN